MTSHAVLVAFHPAIAAQKKSSGGAPWIAIRHILGAAMETTPPLAISLPAL